MALNEDVVEKLAVRARKGEVRERRDGEGQGLRKDITLEIGLAEAIVYAQWVVVNFRRTSVVVVVDRKKMR